MSSVDLAAASSFVTVAAVLAGLVIALLQLRDIKRVREGEVILQANNLFADRFLDSWHLLMHLEFKDYEDFKQRYAGKQEELALWKATTFFEGIGILVKRGIIPLGLADDFFHGVTRVTWLKAEPFIRGYRKEMKLPEAVEWCEYLYNQTKDYRKQDETSPR